MAIEITLPRLGWSMEEGVFQSWLKNEAQEDNPTRGQLWRECGGFRDILRGLGATGFKEALGGDGVPQLPSEPAAAKLLMDLAQIADQGAVRHTFQRDCPIISEKRGAQ